MHYKSTNKEQRKKHSIFKSALAIALSSVMTLGLSACSDETSSQATTESTLFDTYVSNTVIATGNNTIVKSAESVTYRAWLPVEVAGSFDYCFYFSNTIDSTYDDGSVSYVGMSGGNYTIESASISVVGTEFDSNYDPESTVTITFSGETTKDVSPDETFWSDPVNFEIPEGHYLLWEWTITGENFLAICMFNLVYS